MTKVTITFNGKAIEAEEGQMVLQAAEKAGFEIPHYCYHEGLSVAGSCRLCAVEVGYPDQAGQVRMVAPLVMSCQTPVRAGMVILSETERIRQHRRTIMELLLINHPLDCPVCDQAGQCYLQDYSYRYGRPESRFDETKIKQAKKDIGNNVILYSDRCIMCTRCVRFSREVSGGAELAVLNRGNRSEIDVFAGRGLNDKMAGNVVDVCPVGAMLDKQFLFRQRSWFLASAQSVCPGCARGCNISIDHNRGVIYRLRPRFCREVNQHWMCDDGRYGFRFVHADERLKSVLLGRDELQRQVDTDQAEAEIARLLNPYLLGEQRGKLAAVLSPAASCEEQWLWAGWLRELDETAVLVRGPVFSETVDETFKGGFTINAEKVPNRRGAELILGYCAGAQMSFAQLVQAVTAGDIEAVVIQGGYRWCDWCPQESVEKLSRAKVLIVQDIFRSELTRRADVVLAGAAWAEKAGCFVNDQGMCQAFEKAVEPPGNAEDDVRILWRRAGRTTTYNRLELHREMAAAIESLATLAPVVTT